MEQLYDGHGYRMVQGEVKIQSLSSPDPLAPPPPPQMGLIANPFWLLTHPNAPGWA